MIFIYHQSPMYWYLSLSFIPVPAQNPQLALMFHTVVECVWGIDSGGRFRSWCVTRTRNQPGVSFFMVTTKSIHRLTDSS